MINFNRVFAMVLRYTLNMRHNFDRLTDMFFWPAMDIFIWGLTGLYFATLSTRYPNSILIILTGVVFWIVVWRGQYEISLNLLSEIWDKNLVNIFATPLKAKEWIFSVLLVGFFKMSVSLCFSALLAFLLYQYNIFMYGFLIIPLIANLLLTGWVVGFVIAGLLIAYGERVQTIAWAGIFLIAPFSALYYPVSILPDWAQKISAFIPPSYIFEAMREIIFNGSVSYDKIIVSFALNIVYLIISVWFFIFMFNKSKNLGLGRL